MFEGISSKLQNKEGSNKHIKNCGKGEMMPTTASAAQELNIHSGLVHKVALLASLPYHRIKSLLKGRGLSKFKKQYRITGELGQGGFGTVYRGVRIVDELPVAIKFVERHNVHDWGKINDEQAPMEICMLSRCEGISGVVSMVDWFALPEGFLIVMERPSVCTDLFDFTHSLGMLNEDFARFFFRQIVRTTIDCIERKVLHRDLKDENIVIDLATGRTKLVDFGAATVYKKSRYNEFQGTRLYCPPEWFLHSIYMGRESSVWSLGVLLYSMLNGRLPFQNEKDICTAHLIGPLPFFAEQLSLGAQDLMNRCLNFDPSARPTLNQIRAHPWMAERTPCWLELRAMLEMKRQRRNCISPPTMIPTDLEVDSTNYSSNSKNQDNMIGTLMSPSSKFAKNYPPEIPGFAGSSKKAILNPENDRQNELAAATAALLLQTQSLLIGFDNSVNGMVRNNNTQEDKKRIVRRMKMDDEDFSESSLPRSDNNSSYSCSSVSSASM